MTDGAKDNCDTVCKSGSDKNGFKLSSATDSYLAPLKLETLEIYVNKPFFQLFLILVFPVAGFSAVIYVDKGLHDAIWDGVDGHSYTCSNGTGTGYSTIQGAMNAMIQGTTIYMRGGTYNETHIDMTYCRHGLSYAKNKLTSYPGEWAIIDGQYADPAYFRPAVLWATGGARFSNWIFERFEITGGGDPVTLPGEGAGIYINDGPEGCEFRYLYIHDNYSGVSGPGKAGGISLNAPINCVIEYCYIKGNGNPTAERVTSNSQIAITSDYKYGALIDPALSMHSNIIRYNLLDGQGNLGYGVTGFCHKGFQRLTGYEYGETANPSDVYPNDSSLREYGDKIHHNIIINCSTGLRIDQDYCQVYNNIIWLRDGTSDPLIGIESADGQPTTRRGSYYSCFYNNTIYAANSINAIFFAIGTWGHDRGAPAYYHWDCSADGNTCPWAYGYAANNVIQAAMHGYDSMFLSAEMSGNLNCAAPAPVDLLNYNMPRNLFYQCEDYGGHVMRFSNIDYTAPEIDATSVSDITWRLDTGLLFKGSSGADKYTTIGSFPVDETHTIANGGAGGTHPYLADVSIPSYIGATNPGDNVWVAGVLGLNPGYFTIITSGITPSWAEGEQRDTIHPRSPQSLQVH
ncbi:MAG: hypothetical protein A2314_01100 [Elusimicrobia bacterium RIFOXYB2_FULL_50_12]|nr:MAG: hypothetical protein A2314_01100 [Elusimicrobia bacterium RIFOXYB2_FULL_50_12]